MSDINIKSSTVEAAIGLLKGFLEKVIGPSADELGQYMGDNLKIRRLKNQIKNLTRVKEIVEENNISIKQINMKALFPYLEGVSLEEDETLQEMWANMFVNYIDYNKNLTLTVYPSILKQLSTVEVNVLIYMGKNKEKKLDFRESKNIPPYDIEEITNLERLNLIKEDIIYRVKSQPIDHSGFQPDQNVDSTPSDIMKLTGFGSNFLDACRR